MKTVQYFRRMAVVLFMLLAVVQANAATYLVTNTNDAGAGSFRQAIIDANANAGADIIQFLIPDLGLAGQYFEGAIGARFAVIRLIDDLPVITGPVLIDGTTQPNSNTGVMAGKTVGADNIVQTSINYPDVYIVANVAGGYTRSNNTTTALRGYGNGININSVDVTIRGIAISGFGNTSTAAATAGLSGDICVLRSATVRSANTSVTNCFIGSDPLGNAPTAASDRRSLGAAIVIGGNNYSGTISRNYIKNTGTYGIHFNGGVDHSGVGPGTNNLPNRNWVIEENQMIDISWNNSFVGPGNIVTSATGLVADAINTMHCSRFNINKNYIENVEQVGIDIGWNADSNYVSNNSITNFTKTYAGPVQSAIRAALSSKGDSILKNKIYNNSSSAFMAGVWIDMSAPPAATPGLLYYDNEKHVIMQNLIYNNTGSGIGLSNYTPTTLVNNRYNKISQNIIYDNTGIAIDLNYNGITGPTAVTVNDNGDADAGTNDILNFPVIDSVKRTPTYMNIWGKAPAGALLEFFFTDGGSNMHGGRLYNYGEAEYYIGNGVEGGGSDLGLATGLSYSFDGNTATANVNAFMFSFPLLSIPGGVAPFVTASATLADNTSELGPMLGTSITLANELLSFAGKKVNASSELLWQINSNSAIALFEIEHSVNGSQFNTAGKVNYNPERLLPVEFYSFNHVRPNAGNNYYRLKTIYKDGRITYSNVVLLQFSALVFDVKAGPNPFNDKLIIEFTEGVITNYQLRLIDFSGKIINSTSYRSRKGYNSFEWMNLKAAPGQMYILEIVSETGEKWRQKLVH